MFKMLFDHKFRYDRYRAITEHRSKFKNRAQFRSYVYSNYNDFEVGSIQYMNTFPKSKSNNDSEPDQNLKDKLSKEKIESQSQEGENEPNILLRNKILKNYTTVFKLECISKLS